MEVLGGILEVLGGILEAKMSQDSQEHAKSKIPRKLPSGFKSPRRLLADFRGILEVFGGILEAPERVSEVLGGVLEALGS